MPPAELATAGDSDRMLLTLSLMRRTWVQQKPDEAAAKARELLADSPHVIRATRCTATLCLRAT